MAPTTEWYKALARGENLVRLLTITDGVTSWYATDNTNALGYPEAVAEIGSLADSFQLPTRAPQISEAEVTVEDGWIRPIWSGTRIKGKQATLKLGFPGLSSVADYYQIFGGIVDELTPEEDGQHVKLDLVSALVIAEQTSVMGTWYNGHPLDYILDILQRFLPNSLIETADFAPDSYTSISHFVCGRLSASSMNLDLSVRTPVSALALVTELAQLLDGMVYVAESGKIRFRQFSSSAAAAASWTEDDIRSFKQTSVDKLVFNRGEFLSHAAVSDVPMRETYNLRWLGRHNIFQNVYRADVAASQTNYSLDGGTTPRVLPFRIDSPWICGSAIVQPSISDLSGIFAGTVSFVLIGGAVHEFCGARAALPSASQPANAQISAARPLYLMTDTGEIIKATSMTPLGDTTHSSKMMIYDPEGGGRNYEVGPFATGFLISGVSRAQLGTSAAAAYFAYDVTMQVYLIERLLKRHSDGLAYLEVTTGLDQMAVAKGDLVTLTWTDYLQYGADGLGTGTKWEVLSKEVEGSTIKWELASATEVSPTMAHTFLADVLERSHNYVNRAAARNVDVVSPWISTGMRASDTSGGGVAKITVGSGSGRSEGFGSRLPSNTQLTLASNKDNYIHFNTATGIVSQVAVAAGAAAPAMTKEDVLISKVVTGAGTVTSIVESGRVGYAIDPSRVVADATSKTVHDTFSYAPRR